MQAPNHKWEKEGQHKPSVSTSAPTSGGKCASLRVPELLFIRLVQVCVAFSYVAFDRLIDQSAPSAQAYNNDNSNSSNGDNENCLCTCYTHCGTKSSNRHDNHQLQQQLVRQQQQQYKNVSHHLYHHYHNHHHHHHVHHCRQEQLFPRLTGRQQHATMNPKMNTGTAARMMPTTSINNDKDEGNKTSGAGGRNA